MLDLRSPRWKDLSHAYGSAQDIPVLLEQLETASPKLDYQSEPWFSLWSALCHQGDVYTASYAALPHIIALGLKKSPEEKIDFIQISATIEAMRHKVKSPKIPKDLQRPYENALLEGVSLVMSCMDRDWPEAEYRVLLGGLAIFRGHVALGYMLLEFDGVCDCPNCETVFPPLGYNILEQT